MRVCIKKCGTGPVPKLEDGNVLFLILIAVALFAALSYVVTSSNRTGGSTLSRDRAQLAASRILNYASTINLELTRMRESASLPDWRFDYSDNGVYSNSSPNTGCATPDCKLFAVRGGAVPSFNTGKEILASDFIAFYNQDSPFLVFAAVNVLNVGTSAPETVLFVQGLNDEVCRAINRNLLKLDATPVQSVGTLTASKFSGNLSDFPPAAPQTIGVGAPVFAGKTEGCIRFSGNNWNQYYQVLNPR